MQTIVFYKMRSDVPPDGVILNWANDALNRFERGEFSTLYVHECHVTGWRTKLTSEQCKIEFLGEWAESAKNMARGRLTRLPNELNGTIPSSNFPSNVASGKDSLVGYVVEAKSIGDPVVVNNQIFDSNWKRVNFEARKVADLLPSYKKILVDHGLLSYATAQMLRWELHAAVESAGRHLSVETRLVEHSFELNYKITANKAFNHVNAKDVLLPKHQ